MKIFLDTCGCRLNQSEIEHMGAQFRSHGDEIVADAGESDLAVINTCAVTASAVSDSRQKVRHAFHAMETGANPHPPQIIVTGCWATLMPDDVLKLPGVVAVKNNAEKETLALDVMGLPDAENTQPLLPRVPLPGKQMRTRAFIKVQDGCDQSCTFCVTRLARGHSRSCSLESINADVRNALAGGVQEIVLTGVNLAAWGKDLAQESTLGWLILQLLRTCDIPRLRLSSLEPWSLGEDFFALWQDKRLCRHLHLPLQSGCAATLRRMGRKTSPSEFARVVAWARAACPEIAIATDVIVGFPGETESEFSENLSFVESINFAAGHVFSYSPRPGTAALCLPGRIPRPDAKERSLRMRNVILHASERYQESFLGQEVSVLWESATGQNKNGVSLMEGLSDNYLKNQAESAACLWNRVSLVRLTERESSSFKGVILTTPPGGEGHSVI